MYTSKDIIGQAPYKLSWSFYSCCMGTSTILLVASMSISLFCYSVKNSERIPRAEQLYVDQVRSVINPSAPGFASTWISVSPPAYNDIHHSPAREAGFPRHQVSESHHHDLQHNGQYANVCYSQDIPSTTCGQQYQSEDSNLLVKQTNDGAQNHDTHGALTFV